MKRTERRTGAGTKDRTANGGGALGRTDWITAALKLLVAEGESAVRVTRLSAALGVTRGSFYWHFKDRADLLDALLETWESRNTLAIVTAVEEAADLAAAVLGLFACWTNRARFDPKLDSAVREWARRSTTVKRAVMRADERRIAAIAGAFERDGFAPQEALVRARIIYFTQVGYYALDWRETLAQRLEHLERYFKGFTGRSLAPAQAAAFRRRLQGQPKAPGRRKAA